jgi:sialic acid synthase SpsE
MRFKINKNYIGDNYPTYFIADISANHDGSLSRAKKLIKLCAESGANAAKFQHFRAETIVSDFGFKKIGKLTHQNKWKKSVYQVYKDASINFKWTAELKNECKKYNIDFFSAPYDLNYVDQLNQHMQAFKIGSGDVSWHEIIEKIAKKKKPVFLATGASEIDEVKKAFNVLYKKNKKICLMQCNTNYTGEKNNFNFLNINVLKTFKKIFRDKAILGLSDHTDGHTSVLAAVTLGARVIEKHFTDDNSRIGPDHPFSMNPKTWSDMVLETRNLERCLGDGVKRIELNEKQSVIVQRRSIRAKKFIKKGHKIESKDIICLRPCPKNSLPPFKKRLVLEKKAKRNILKGDVITLKSIS